MNESANKCDGEHWPDYERWLKKELVRDGKMSYDVAGDGILVVKGKRTDPALLLRGRS